MGSLGHPFKPSTMRPVGIYGVFGDELSLSDAHMLGRAFGTFIERKGGRRIAVAFDGRPSSADLVTALSMGLISVGAHVTRVGRGPTSMLRYGMRLLDSDGGIMVTTRSFGRNQKGFRLFLARGPCDSSELEQIMQIATSGDCSSGYGDREEVAILESYVSDLVEGATTTNSALKVVWSADNPATGDALRALVRHLPASQFLLDEFPDEIYANDVTDEFDHERLKQLRAFLATEPCHMGVAVRGEGEGITILDQSGQIVAFEALIFILAGSLLRERRQFTNIVLDNRVSDIVLKYIGNLNARTILVEPNVAMIERMVLDVGAAFGAHLDGHMIFSDGDVVRHDAIYTAIRLQEALAQANSVTFESSCRY